MSSRKFHLQHVVGVKSGLGMSACAFNSLNHLVRVTHAMYVRPRGYISRLVFHTTIRIKELLIGCTFVRCISDQGNRRLGEHSCAERRKCKIVQNWAQLCRKKKEQNCAEERAKMCRRKCKSVLIRILLACTTPLITLSEGCPTDYWLECCLPPSSSPAKSKSFGIKSEADDNFIKSVQGNFPSAKSLQ